MRNAMQWDFIIAIYIQYDVNDIHRQRLFSWRAIDFVCTKSNGIPTCYRPIHLETTSIN